MLLDHIKQSSDIKKLKEDQYPELAREIRQFLIEKISKTGGHLASNLGVVELTMALHLAFDLPKDKIVWDVGHQAYTHKLLSGRKAGFDDLRQFGRRIHFQAAHHPEAVAQGACQHPCLGGRADEGKFL